MIVLNGVGALASAPWTVIPSDYRYDMSLYLDVTFAAAKMDYSQYEVAVFSGEQCRGIAEVLPLGNGNECLYLRARSNQESGETMTFKYYNKETEEIQPIEGVSFTFESNGRLGYPSDPYIVGIYTYYDVELLSSIGGSLDVNVKGDRVAEGTELKITAIPDTGYHFTKWSDGEVENPRTIIVNDNIYLSAIFEVSRSFKLTYVVNGTIYKEVDVYEYSPIIPESGPVQEGYTFSGWEGLPEVMPSNDVIVYGTLTINSYNLNLYLNDELYHTELVEYGSELNITAPKIPEGKKFDGWIDEIPETMPAHDVDIHGTYSDTSSISDILIDDNQKVVICTLNGFVIYKNVLWHDVQSKLENGLYIINGTKYLIQR